MIYGHHNLQTEAHQRNRDLLITALATLGVTRAQVNYSGAGDSGDTCEAEILPKEQLAAVQNTKVAIHQVRPTYFSQSQQPPAITEREMPLIDALQEFSMIWVELHHGGWENDDGGSGTVTLDVTENTCTLEHVEFYTESTQYEYAM